MGAALVMFLPLVGFFMAGRELRGKTRRLVAARTRCGLPAEHAAPMRKAA